MNRPIAITATRDIALVGKELPKVKPRDVTPAKPAEVAAHLLTPGVNTLAF